MYNDFITKNIGLSALAWQSDKKLVRISVVFFVIKFGDKIFDGGCAALDKTLKAVFVHGVNDGVSTRKLMSYGKALYSQRLYTRG